MTDKNKTFLKFLTFNVEGLKSKLDDPSFQNYFIQNDIVVFLETWLDKKESLKIEGFWDYSQIRKKHDKAIRHSGGITILVKNCFRPGIKLVKDEEGFIWFKLLKSFFELDNDLFVCAAYIPPQNTTRRISNKTDYWENLTKSIIDYNSKGNILITGDLNARVGINKYELNLRDKQIDQLCPIEHNWNLINRRNNCDIKVNKFGKNLIEICNSFNLTIANGKIAGNRLGNFTCFNSGGASVVDYLIGDSTVISNMSEMLVHPPIFNSKHTPITTKINISTIMKKNNENLSKAPEYFTWDEPSGKIFAKFLSSSRSINILNNIKENLTSGNSKDDIDIAATRLTNLLKSTAIKSLKLSKRTSNRVKSKINKWYDNECANLKKRIDNLAYLFSKNPKDPYVSGKFYKCRKEYNKMIKEKKRNADIIDINSLKKLTDNPSQFWKKIKKMRSNKVSLNSITPTEWYNHFSKLTNDKNKIYNDIYKKQHEDVLAKLKNKLDDEHYNNKTELDNPFTQKEIEDGIDNLSNHKASGNDSIKNEMLISTKKIISSLLTELFNKIKLLEYYPDVWLVGIITPLYKSDDIGEPDNYRGITINSCLSKLFTKLMNDRLNRVIEKII